MSETTATPNTRDPNASRDWMRQIQTQQRRVDEENGVLRNLYKRAKLAGENVKEMRSAIRATKQDPVEAVMDMRDRVFYMALRNIPVTPVSLFDGIDIGSTEKTKRDDDMWDAQEKGYRAGRHGVRIDENPYAPGTELNVEWHVWWQKGQAAIARELGPDAKPADPSRQRPMRGAQQRIPGTEDRQDSPRKAAARKTARKKAARKGARRPRRNGPVMAEDGVPVY